MNSGFFLFLWAFVLLVFPSKFNYLVWLQTVQLYEMTTQSVDSSLFLWFDWLAFWGDRQLSVFVTALTINTSKTALAQFRASTQGNKDNIPFVLRNTSLKQYSI